MQTLERPPLEEYDEQKATEDFDRVAAHVDEDRTRHAELVAKIGEASTSTADMVDTIFDYYKPKALTEGHVGDEHENEKLAQHRSEAVEAVVSLFGKRLEGGDQTIIAEYRERKDSLFADLGFKPSEANEVLRSWASFNPTDMSADLVRQTRLDNFKQNFEAMAQIDAARPGAAAELFRRDGIRNFMRYRPAELLHQLTSENKRPTEVVLSAADDWNGAFTASESMSNARQHVLMEEPIYLEAARPIEAFIRMARVKERTGVIERIFVNAHGDDDSFELRSANTAVDVASLQRTKAIEQLIEQGVLQPDAAIILSSCEGIPLGKEVSRQTQGTVVSSGIATEGLYLLEPGTDKYVNMNRGGAKAKLFEQGKRVDGVRRVRRLGRRALAAFKHAA